MFLTASVCSLVLCSSQILSAFATLRVVDFSSDVVFNPLALHKTIARNILPSSTALQAVNGLDGYMIWQKYSDKTCTDLISAFSQELNYCRDTSYGSRIKRYELITASATSANTTEYIDSACTIPLRRGSIFTSEPSMYTTSLSDACVVDEHVLGGSRKDYHSMSSDVATTTRAVVKLA
jgi:hypothetical protein